MTEHERRATSPGNRDEDERRDEMLEAEGEGSFPASDPPSSSPVVGMGSPDPEEPDTDPDADEDDDTEPDDS